MPLTPVRPTAASASVLRRWLAPLLAGVGRMWRDRRGSIAVIVAVSAIPLAIASGAAVDMSRMISTRSVLQRAVDNAALSGAAAYVLYTQGDTYNAKAQTTARVAFCKAAVSLPGGFTLVSSGATACTSTPGAAVSAVIAGYTPGTRGTQANSGCTATHTVSAGFTCGFIVTVSTSATVATIFPFLLGGTAKVSVSASAINPFINLANAIKPNFNGSAGNANSLWVYPLLLDANGAPDFSTNAGALPDASACTGSPVQTSCGSYTMLASTHFLGCPKYPPLGGCTYNGVTFVNGIVQNPVVGTAVITATTPLGVALQSAAGVDYQAGYYSDNYSYPSPSDKGCNYSAVMAYNTFDQEYDNNGYPLEVDANGNWTLVTHWLYSSFLANGYPPDYNEIQAQSTTQTVPAVPTAARNVTYNPTASPATPVACPNPSGSGNAASLTTAYPTSGSTNCALYIVKDPTSLVPNPSYHNNSSGNAPTCFTPSGTPGYQYAALSCQNYAGHSYAFFWNDMSGNNATRPPTDDTDYGNGTLVVACSGASYVLLIN